MRVRTNSIDRVHNNYRHPALGVSAGDVFEYDYNADAGGAETMLHRADSAGPGRASGRFVRIEKRPRVRVLLVW